MKNERISKIIKEEITQLIKEGYFDDMNMDTYDGGEFDRMEFDGDAKDTAVNDFEDDGIEFTDLGDSKFEKGMDVDEFKSNLEKANLRLPSDEKETKKIAGDLERKMQMKKSMGNFSLNEKRK